MSSPNQAQKPYFQDYTLVHFSCTVFNLAPFTVLKGKPKNRENYFVIPVLFICFVIQSAFKQLI